MTKLEEKHQNLLDEVRMLVLGVEVLLGFGFRAFLEPRFNRLPPETQIEKLCALLLLVMTFALLVSPIADHQIREGGEITQGAYGYAATIMALALAPFGASMVLDGRVALEASLQSFLPAMTVGATAVVAVCLYGPIVLRRGNAKMAEEKLPTSVSTKVRQVLTEARVILPGAQALLGFSLIATLMDGFEKLPLLAQRIHILGLLSVALAVIILMTPAAYHRLAEQGEDTQSFHRIASALVLAALVPLGFGIACGVYVAVAATIHSAIFAILAAGAVFACLLGFWLGFPLARRFRHR
ncbi:DUF6328 family protein [Aminobacter sp. MET-1]|uniref:DUF6328 family protein n=1 Tax=Aminobacter sp. MET-1 TaxID=2951085 RepID=UPI00226A85A5|nr:DUF6328 family protein [Aminobacter sp. MET-1]MCX8570767.1 DUF6328 family protein [Aminobacter sp. MET-1]